MRPVNKNIRDAVSADGYARPRRTAHSVCAATTQFTLVAIAILMVAGCSGARTTLSESLTLPADMVAGRDTSRATAPLENRVSEPKTLLSKLPGPVRSIAEYERPRLPHLAEPHDLAPPVSPRTTIPSSARNENVVLSSYENTRLHQTPTATHPANNLPTDGGTITIGGQTYEIRLVTREQQTAAGFDVRPAALTSAGNSVTKDSDLLHTTVTNPLDAAERDIQSNNVSINLPTALSMVGGDHPAVAFSQWRVQEAYAQLDGARTLWLPSLQAGFSLHRHDGNYQASNGAIVDVNRSSFQYGLGAGATGAGTNPRHGLQAQFHLADAIFQPEIARTTAWARGHAANAVVNQQMLEVALAYLALLDATQQLRIVEASRDRTAQISKLTDDYAAAGQGLQADADRMQTELTLMEGRIAVAREAADLASARLAHALSARADQRFVPMDVTIVPIQLVSTQSDKTSLIQTGLANRPELKESQALVAAACEQYRRQKYSPFVPSVLLGMSTGEFGGGTGTTIGNVDGRFDFDALVTWEIRNLGFGERSARNESAARVQQAKYRKIRLLDDVAREISEAHTQTLHREQRMAVTEHAITTAEDSFQRDLSRIRDGQGLPLEVLQSVRALEAAQQAYADAVIAYNESQFRLQWALGWQLSAGRQQPEAMEE